MVVRLQYRWHTILSVEFFSYIGLGNYITLLKSATTSDLRHLGDIFSFIKIPYCQATMPGFF